MRADRIAAPTYVIKALELHALNNLPDDFPRPQGLEWINRGLDERRATLTDPAEQVAA